MKRLSALVLLLGSASVFGMGPPPPDGAINVLNFLGGAGGGGTGGPEGSAGGMMGYTPNQINQNAPKSKPQPPTVTYQPATPEAARAYFGAIEAAYPEGLNPCRGCADPARCQRNWADQKASQDWRRIYPPPCGGTCGDPNCGKGFEFLLAEKYGKTPNHIPPPPPVRVEIPAPIPPPPPPPVQQTGLIDLATIPDVEVPYHFRSDPGEFRDQVERQYKDLYKINPAGDQRQAARDFGLISTEQADESFSLGQQDQAQFYREIGKSFLDVAVGLDPVTGFARSSYELFSGTNAITGEALHPLERGLAFIGVVTAGSSSTLIHGAEGIARIVNRGAHLLRPGVAHGIHEAIQTGTRIAEGADAANRSFRGARNAPGIANTSRVLSDANVFLTGTQANAGLIPRSIAQGLEGRQFRSFKQFRKEFWKTVANSPYANEFERAYAGNLEQMRKGRAPYARFEQGIGNTLVNPTHGRARYELHHLEPIQHGGSVYDLSNILVSTPNYHVRVFHQ